MKRRPPWYLHARDVAMDRYNRRVQQIVDTYGPGGDKYVEGDYITASSLVSNVAYRLLNGGYDPEPPRWWWRATHPFSSWPTP